MNFKEIEEWRALTARMVEDPQTGDYFTDHMSPVALIVDRHGDDIKLAKPHYALGVWDDGHWMSVAKFREWVSYGSVPRFWVEGHRKEQMPWDKTA